MAAASDCGCGGISGLVEGPSVCGAAVCVQLIGASAMAGCEGQKQQKQKTCEMTEMCHTEKKTKFNTNTEELREDAHQGQGTVIPLSTSRLLLFIFCQFISVFHIDVRGIPVVRNKTVPGVNQGKASLKINPQGGEEGGWR